MEEIRVSYKCVKTVAVAVDCAYLYAHSHTESERLRNSTCKFLIDELRTDTNYKNIPLVCRYDPIHKEFNIYALTSYILTDD